MEVRVSKTYHISMTEDELQAICRLLQNPLPDDSDEVIRLKEEMWEKLNCHSLFYGD